MIVACQWNTVERKQLGLIKLRRKIRRITYGRRRLGRLNIGLAGRDLSRAAPERTITMLAQTNAKANTRCVQLESGQNRSLA